MLRTSVCITAVIVAVGLSAPAFAGQPLSQATDFFRRKTKIPEACRASLPRSLPAVRRSRPGR